MAIQKFSEDLFYFLGIIAVFNRTWHEKISNNS